jgi:hypothetical protein
MNVTLELAFTTMFFGVTPAPVIVMVVVSTGVPPPPPPPPVEGPDGDPPSPQDHTASASTLVRDADASQCLAMNCLPERWWICRGRGMVHHAKGWPGQEPQKRWVQAHPAALTGAAHLPAM